MEAVIEGEGDYIEWASKWMTNATFVYFIGNKKIKSLGFYAVFYFFWERVPILYSSMSVNAVTVIDKINFRCDFLYATYF